MTGLLSLPLHISLLFCLSFIGILLSIIFLFMKKNTGYGLLTGYSLIGFSIFFILMTTKNILFDLSYLIAPTSIILLVSFIIYQTITYLKIINSRHLLNTYTNFTTIITLFIAGMVGMFFKNTLDSNGEKEKPFNGTIVNVVSVLLFIIVGFISLLNQIILKDFVTDG